MYFPPLCFFLCRFLEFQVSVKLIQQHLPHAHCSTPIVPPSLDTSEDPTAGTSVLRLLRLVLTNRTGQLPAMGVYSCVGWETKVQTKASLDRNSPE